MITIHTKVGCPYCENAKKFLKQKGLPFREIVYDPSQPDYVKRARALVNATKHETFPQIHIGPIFIGGYTELVASYRKGI